jgi:hypothetical protein
MIDWKQEGSMNRYIRYAVILSILFLSFAGIYTSTSASWVMNSQSPSSTTTISGELPWRGQYIQRIINPPTQLGGYPSIAFDPVTNTPYVSYYNKTAGDLMLASPVPNGGSNCGVNGNWWCRPVDGQEGADVGQYSSIGLWAESPEYWKIAISYYDVTHRALKAAIWTCLIEVCAWNIDTIIRFYDDTISVGLFTSLKFDPSGVIHIAYYYAHSDGVDALMYARFVGIGGNCGMGIFLDQWECELIDAGEGVGQYTSLDIDANNRPTIAYYAATQGELRITRHTPGNCGLDSDWLCETIDGWGTDVGKYAALESYDNLGAPTRIAYYDQDNGNLKIYDGILGVLVVDHMGTSPSPMGIAMRNDPDGNPIIVYQQIVDEYSPPVLRIARPYFVDAELTYGNCGDVPPGYLFQYWYCTTLDFSGQYTDEADFASIALSPSGFAAVAYSEYDSYHDATNLKVMYQYAHTFLPFLDK